MASDEKFYESSSKLPPFCLSSVHLKVAREVYNNCVRGAISQKTRILVTNQLQFVAGSDTVLFMADGRIAEAGSYNDLMKAGKGFAKLMQQAEVRQIRLQALYPQRLSEKCLLC